MAGLVGPGLVGPLFESLSNDIVRVGPISSEALVDPVGDIVLSCPEQ